MLLENKANIEAVDKVKKIFIAKPPWLSFTRLDQPFSLLCRFINKGWGHAIDTRLQDRSHWSSCDASGEQGQHRGGWQGKKVFIVKTVDFDETTVVAVRWLRLTSCLLCCFINKGWVDFIDVRLQRSHWSGCDAFGEQGQHRGDRQGEEEILELMAKEQFDFFVSLMTSLRVRC
jgi:hypothetical protein